MSKPFKQAKIDLNQREAERLERVRKAHGFKSDYELVKAAVTVFLYLLDNAQPATDKQFGVDLDSQSWDTPNCLPGSGSTSGGEELRRYLAEQLLGMYMDLSSQ